MSWWIRQLVGHTYQEISCSKASTCNRITMAIESMLCAMAFKC
jgi:hypothetical protein